MKLMILGYARHGKDTACEILCRHFDLRFESSSHFVGRKAVWPLLRYKYENFEECYRDRGSSPETRTFWFEEITKYNTPDKARLARELYAEYDIYCGLRNQQEFEAVKAEGLFDWCLWIDASKRLPPEGTGSCTVRPNDADFVVSNNDSLDNFQHRLVCLGVGLGLTRRNHGGMTPGLDAAAPPYPDEDPGLYPLSNRGHV
jgi:hypothetical protein